MIPAIGYECSNIEWTITPCVLFLLVCVFLDIIFSLALQENYGVDDMNSVEHIKKIFNDYQLPKLFEKYENESYEKILKLIENNCTSLPKEMFMALVRKIFKRQKWYGGSI